MKIVGLEIDGYGVWTGLKIEKLGETLNVFYGPNEAGKTTLLQFIRAMFYGFSRRRQYLPPVHGGRPGGAIELSGPHGRFTVARYDDSSPDGADGEQLTLTAPDGTRQGAHFINVLLSQVDEPVFNNVFAVGLREIQELATLGDTEAAELLYGLSAGLDRVSLVEVLRELENSRNRLLDAGGGPSQIAQLLAEREKLRAELEELAAINRRYGRLAAEQDALGREIGQLEEDVTRDERLCRVIELAVSLRERWRRRTELDEQLAALTPLGAMPAGAVERLDAVNAKFKRHRRRLARLTQLREDAKREFAGLTVNETLWRQAARIEAFKEQEPWLAQLREQVDQLHGEVERLDGQLAAEGERLGFGADPSALSALGAAGLSQTLSSLRQPAKTLRQGRRRLAEARQTAATAEQAAAAAARELETALAAGGHKDLTAALDSAGGLVSQLRRRAQIDERLDQLARYQAELEDRGRRLLDSRLLPVGVLAVIGGAFVLGVVLILVGLFFPQSMTRSVGWALTVLGLVGSGAAVVGKLLLERLNAQQLDGCQKQLGVLRMQIQQTREDRDALDAQLPRGGGAIAGRLQAAERELAAWEELAPLEARRSAARQQAQAAAQRAAEAKDDLNGAARRWREALAAAGLPETLDARQVQRLAQDGGRLADVQRRAVERRDELARRQRELDGLTARIAQLAADAGVPLNSTDPIEQLRQLAEAAAQQTADAARRDALRAQARRIRAARSKHEEAVSALKHRRRRLFIEAGVGDEREFRRRALEIARAEVLRQERDAVGREIQAAVGTQCSEEAIERQLAAADDAGLESRRDALRRQLDDADRRLRELLENRGRLGEQLAALAADRQLPAKHLELAVLEKRLDDAVHRWRVLALACRVMETIRTIYERERQPETLREASIYLNKLTQERYRRAWTPLGERTLRVDDAEGRSLPVEALSRGTREQLFLSLRLALASSYARRGAELPLVLDDVLVNFDSERAKSAAAVLRDFAAEGHQLLVFTCHEHILKMFKSLRVPVSRLPSNAQPGESVTAEDEGEGGSP